MVIEHVGSCQPQPIAWCNQRSEFRRRSGDWRRAHIGTHAAGGRVVAALKKSLPPSHLCRHPPGASQRACVLRPSCWRDRDPCWASRTCPPPPAGTQGFHAQTVSPDDQKTNVVGLWTRSWVVMPWLENARSDSAVIPTHRPASPAVGPWGISCNLNRDFLFCDLWPSRSRLTRPPLPWYHDTLVTGRAGSAHTCASVPTLDSGGSAEHERQHPSAFRRRP